MMVLPSEHTDALREIITDFKSSHLKLVRDFLSVGAGKTPSMEFGPPCPPPAAPLSCSRDHRGRRPPAGALQLLGRVVVQSPPDDGTSSGSIRIPEAAIVWIVSIVVVEELFQELSAIFVVVIEGRGDFIPVAPRPPTASRRPCHCLQPLSSSGVSRRHCLQPPSAATIHSCCPLPPGLPLPSSTAAAATACRLPPLAAAPATACSHCLHLE